LASEDITVIRAVAFQVQYSQVDFIDKKWPTQSIPTNQGNQVAVPRPAPAI